MATPSIEVVRQLPDGNWLLRVNSEERQTITLEQKRLMLTTQAERDSLLVQKAALQDQVKILEQIVGTGKRIEANQAAQIARDEVMLTATNSVLLELRGLVDDYKRAAKVGKLTAILNNPAVKALQVVAPIVAAVLAR